MMRMLARIMGIGIETADMLVHEVLSRKLRDQRGVARYGGLTGSPDESGSKRRERGLARAGNARVRRGMIQLAWRWLMFQHRSALAQWYRTRTAGAKARIAQSHDRRIGTQTADRPVALRHERRRPGRCRPAFGNMNDFDRKQRRELSIQVWRWSTLRSGMNAKMIRGGSDPFGLHGFDADQKNGPASEEPRRRCV
jgi:Transposase IS116/IS110/IS902 family